VTMLEQSAMLWPDYLEPAENMPECERRYWASADGQAWLRWSAGLSAKSQARDRKAARVIVLAVGFLAIAILGCVLA
jgi:hypothetical protein